MLNEQSESKEVKNEMLNELCSEGACSGRIWVKLRHPVAFLNENEDVKRGW